jgi:hypothetical protein
MGKSNVGKVWDLGRAGLDGAPRSVNGDAASELVEFGSGVKPLDGQRIGYQGSLCPLRPGGEIWNMVGYRRDPGRSSELHEQLMAVMI